MERKILKVGTRASPLALIQTQIVCDTLKQVYPHLETQIVPMTTTGDKIQDKKLSAIGGKGLFTKEIEEALLRKDIHIAIHSMKDMPTTYPAGLHIPCVLEREDPRDGLVYIKPLSSLQELPAGTVVGTSSLRREAQILNLNKTLKVVPIRGNVQTRLRKMEDGEAQATIMALAGLKRLGLEAIASYIFSPEEMIPAIGQGIIGVECREDDPETTHMLRSINHRSADLCLRAERAFLKALDGSCQTPIGGHCQLQNQRLHMKGFIARPGGRDAHTLMRTGDITSPETLGLSLAQDFLDKVGRDYFK